MKNVKPLAILVLAIMLTSMVAQIPQTNLVASYLFNNNFNRTPAGTVAINHGGSFTADRFGNANSSFSVSNNNVTNSVTARYVQIPNPGGTFFNNNFTIIFWFKSSNVNNGRRMYLLSNDQNGIGTNLNFELNDANAYYLYWNGQGIPGLTGEALNLYTDNNWHQVVIRRTSNLVELFIDMNLKSSTTAFTPSIPSPPTIGSNTCNIVMGFNKASYIGPPALPNLFNPLGFDGAIDDVCFYNAALNNTILTSNYNNLIADFDFNGGLTDKSGFGNVATRGKLYAANPNTDLPVLSNDRFGNCNNAYLFNGKGFITLTQFASNSQLTGLNFFSNDFTIAYWVKSNVSTKRMYSFCVDNNTTSTPNNNLGIEFGDSDTPAPACWAYWNGQGAPGITVNNGSKDLYYDNSWHFVVLTRKKSSGNVSLYIDNVLKGSYTDLAATIGSNSQIMHVGHIRQPWVIATFPIFDTYGWVGLIDDIKFYNKTLSSSEINSLFTVNSSQIVINFPKVNDNWAVNSKHNITWTSVNSNSVDIAVSYNSGSTWTTLASNLASVSSGINKFQWTIPNNVSANRLIRIKYSSIACPVVTKSFNIIASQQATCYTWQCLLNGATGCTQKDTNIPRWRDGAELKTFTNPNTNVTKMYLMGGWNPIIPYPTNPSDGSQAFNHDTTARSNEVWSTVNGINWTKEKAFTPVTYPNTTSMWEQRHVFNNYVYNGKIWVIGGDLNQGHYQNDIWNTSDGVNWTYVSVIPSTPANLSTLQDRFNTLNNNFAGKMWVMGGQRIVFGPSLGVNWDGIGNNPSSPNSYNDVYSTTNGFTWTRHSDAPWSPRGLYSGNVVLNGKMWVLGGGLYQAAYYNDVWSTSDGNNWVNDVDFAPWFGRHFHNVAVFDNKMWVIGGANPNAIASGLADASSNLKDVWYSSDGVNWYELPNTPWNHRHAASVEVFNNELYVMAGNNGPLYSATAGQGPIDVHKLTCGSGSRPLSINNNASEASQIVIYPNPSNGSINIDLSQHNNQGNYSVDIYNTVGVKVYSEAIKGNKVATLDNLTLVNGIYLLTILDQKGIIIKTEKIVFEK